MQTFQKYICHVSSELVTSVQVIVVLHHLQNHHESPAAAGSVSGFGDKGKSTSHKVKSGLVEDFQGAS